MIHRQVAAERVFRPVGPSAHGAGVLHGEMVSLHMVPNEVPPSPLFPAEHALPRVGPAVLDQLHVVRRRMASNWNNAAMWAFCSLALSLSLSLSLLQAVIYNTTWLAISQECRFNLEGGRKLSTWRMHS